MILEIKPGIKKIPNPKNNMVNMNKQILFLNAGPTS